MPALARNRGHRLAAYRQCSVDPMAGDGEMRSVWAGVGSVVILAIVGCAQAGGGGERRAGFYLVLGEAESAAALPAATAEQRVVLYDYSLVQEADRERPRYLLLSKTADVPLVLAKAPELRQKGENGHPELRLELTRDAATRLEKLTRDHLGARVAFVIDDQPVTLHKIRSAITGVQFRLSRCTDTACQYIYGQLAAKR